MIPSSLIEVGPKDVHQGQSVFVKYWNCIRPARVVKVARRRIRVEIETKSGYFIGSWRHTVFKEGNGQKVLGDFK